MGFLLFSLRHGLSFLRRAKWFAIGAALTFALALGVNLAIFSVIDRALFRPWPVRDPDRLVTAFSDGRDSGERSFSIPKWVAVEAKRTGVIDRFGFAGRNQRYELSRLGEEPLFLTEASWNLLDVLGIPCIAGRCFSRSDIANQQPVAVIREEVWESRFNRDSRVVGTLLTDGSIPIEIIGVIARGVIIPSVNWNVASHGFILDSFGLASLESTTPTDQIPGIVARIPTGQSYETTQLRVNALTAALAKSLNRPVGHIAVEPLRAGVFWRNWAGLRLLFGGAILVFVLGCFNLGTLILARARERESEVAIRCALGASRAQVAWLLMVETMAICAVGSIVASIAFQWGSRVLTSLVPAFFRPMVVTQIDARVIAFASIVSIGGSLAACAAPVWSMTRTNPRDLLQGAVRSGVWRGRRTARSLIVVQTAICVPLLVMAAISASHLINLVSVDLGFAPKQLFLANAGGPPHQNASVIDSNATLLALLMNGSATESVSVTNVALGGRDTPEAVRNEAGIGVVLRRVGHRYFTTMGSQIIAGREFSREEIAAEAPVMILSENSLEKLLPGQTPNQAIREWLRFEGHPLREVVGVAENARAGYLVQTTPDVFVPVRAQDIPTFVIRAKPGFALDSKTLFATFQMAGFTGRPSITAVSSRLAQEIELPRAYAWSLGLFALVAVILSLVGLVSLASQDVTARLRDVGVMLALGASRRQVTLNILLTALRPVCWGLLAGSVGAWWAAVLVERTQRLNESNTLAWIVAVASLVVASSIGAVWHPALRAGRIDPGASLRDG